MIDYQLCCDDCGTIIDGGMTSASETRRKARLQNIFRRVRGRELCLSCAELIAPTSTASKERT